MVGTKNAMTALKGGRKNGQKGIRIIMFLVEEKADVAVNDMFGVKIVLVGKVKPSSAVVVGEAVETLEGCKVDPKGEDDARGVVLPFLHQR